MIGVNEGLRVVDGVLEGSVADTKNWYPLFGFCPTMTVLMGDPVTGPAFQLFDVRAIDRDAPHRKSTAHSHPSDTFRMAIGPQSEQFRIGGAPWMGFGDYHVMAANEAYVQTNGNSGAIVLDVYADRRGMPHGYDAADDVTQMLGAEPAEFLAQVGVKDVFAFHEDLDDAVSSVSTTFAELPGGRCRLQGSVYDETAWRHLADGSTAAAIFLADRTSGPAILLSHNTPGAIESPAGVYSTDVCRVVIEGSVIVDGRTFGPGSFRVLEAGVPESRVVHGPNGSRQFLMLADRRGLPPLGEGACCSQLVELAALIRSGVRHDAVDRGR